MKQFKKLSFAFLSMLLISSFQMSASMRRVAPSAAKSLVPTGVRGIFTTTSGETYALASERSNPETAKNLKDLLVKGERVQLVQNGMNNYKFNPYPLSDKFGVLYAPVVRMSLNNGKIDLTEAPAVAIGYAGVIDERDELLESTDAPIGVLPKTWPTHAELINNSALIIDPSNRLEPSIFKQLKSLDDYRKEAIQDQKKMEDLQKHMDDEFAKDPFAGRE